MKNSFFLLTYAVYMIQYTSKATRVYFYNHFSMTQNKYISMCIILASFSSLFTFSHASERPQQVDFEEYAKTYLDNSKDTEYWKGKNPQLS